MFGFIKKLIKIRQIYKTQLRQQVIFLALDAGEYFICEHWAEMPDLAKTFCTTIEPIIGNNKLKLSIKVNDEIFPLIIDLQNESIIYFTNFLESILCFENCKSYVYVSSTDNTNDFFCINKVSDDIYRIMAIVDVQKDKRILDTCVYKNIFEEQFLKPLEGIEPFDKVKQNSSQLKKYSPKVIKLPIQ